MEEGAMSMRYDDLIQFEPIESVIQLLDANRPDEAKKLVSTYVISDDMAERIAKLMIPQLSFDEAVDHKGVLVVGNYGTGKSHLMSVLSLVAEDIAYVPLIQHTKVAEAAEAIAGKFKVHRIEISSQMSLRDIITQQLELFLEKHGVSYAFPPADKVTNNKAAFEEIDGGVRRGSSEPRRSSRRRRVPRLSPVPQGSRSRPRPVLPARDRRGHKATCGSVSWPVFKKRSSTAAASSTSPTACAG